MEVDDEVDHCKWSDLLDDLLHLIIDRSIDCSATPVKIASVSAAYAVHGDPSLLTVRNCIQRLLYRHRLPVLMIPIPASTNNNEDDYNVKNREEFEEAYNEQTKLLMIPIPASTNNNEDDYNVKNREEFEYSMKIIKSTEILVIYKTFSLSLATICSLLLLYSMMESMMDIDESVTSELHGDYGNWSELHGDLLLLVIERVFSNSTIEDYIRFGSVCCSWRSMYVQSNCIQRLPTRNRLPVLMIPIPEDSTTRGNNDCNVKNREEYKVANKDTMNKRSFYSLKDNKVNNNFRLNVPDNRYCFGSSFGWLVTVDMDDSNDYIPNEGNDGEFLIRLVNPFLPINCNEINLPSLRTFSHVPHHPVVHFMHMNKAIVSANPTNTDDYIVIAIYSGLRRLAFCKRGDTHWTDVHTKGREYPFADVIYYKGFVYGLDNQGVVVAYDISDSNRQKITRIAEAPPGINTCTTKYIVESSGYLFQVHRNVRTSDDYDEYFTDDIQVFKLQFEMNKPKWIQVYSLDGHAFFLGDNGSMSLLASDFPGCKPNAIYFTDDSITLFLYDLSQGPCDMGVFDVEDEIFEPLYQPPTNSEAASLWPNPIWVEPTPSLRN